MKPLIHPSAQIAPSAYIAPGAIVQENAVVGAECIIEHYAVVGRHTTLGRDCHVHPFAVVGGPAQDRRTQHLEPHALIVGDGNIFREGCTVSRGTAHGQGCTRIGAGNLFMAHSHIGHDCIIGNGITLSNGVSLAGHVIVEDNVSMGGHSAVHQFTRIGRLAFIAANAMVSRDVLPFCLAAGDRARLKGLNLTGLERAKFTGEELKTLKTAFRDLFRRQGQSMSEVTQSFAQSPSPLINEWFEFIKHSQRGVMGSTTADQ